MVKTFPTPSPQVSLKALQAMIAERHPLAAMQVLHEAMGDVFRISLPGFAPVVMVGPEAAHYVLVDRRGDLRWRNENDPVTHLLRHGVLVEDGDDHDRLRRLMNPSLHRRMLEEYAIDMLQSTDQVTASWRDGSQVDILVEMRKITLLILTCTLFRVDYSPELNRLWDAVLGVIGYISPGLWMLWRGAPRPGYQRHIHRMDEYLYRIITLRRRQVDANREEPSDLLGGLIAAGLEDGLIRDQLLTMLIAGHDTSTALLAWSLYLLGSHPEAMERAQVEVDELLAGSPPDAASVQKLEFLSQVVQEALRLYPPIHLGSRVAACDLEYEGYTIPAGERVIYSIYLTQRHPLYFPDPNSFRPERHAGGERTTLGQTSVPGKKVAAYSWLAFGGGPRNCIGSAFGQLETKLVLARVLQRFTLELVERKVYPHMGATLEPRPGVKMRVHRRLGQQD